MVLLGFVPFLESECGSSGESVDDMLMINILEWFCFLTAFGMLLPPQWNGHKNTLLGISSSGTSRRPHHHKCLVCAEQRDTSWTIIGRT